jgi:hypothetical protein
MRAWRLLPLLVLPIGFPSFFLAQSPVGTESKPEVVRFRDGGANGSMESIFIPPKANAPFSLTLAAEWSRPLGNGGTFTLTNERHIVRDGKGRIYQERAALVPRNGKAKTFVTTIQITDPDQHTWFNCIVATKVCDLYFYRHSSSDSFQPAMSPTGTDSSGDVFHQHEDLGVSGIQGEDTHGYRETTTVNAGVAGNDRPMVSTREFWYSARLGINLISTVDTPQAGKQVFTVKDLSTSEPDPILFEVPTGYKIADHLKDEN